jgi:hypothetical protein
MKIKDLPPGTSMGGLKVKTSDGRIGYWTSQWNRGIWLKNNLEDKQVHPVFVDSLEEVLEWEVVNDKEDES